MENTRLQECRGKTRSKPDSSQIKANGHGQKSAIQKNRCGPENSWSNKIQEHRKGWDEGNKTGKKEGERLDLNTEGRKGVQVKLIRTGQTITVAGKKTKALTSHKCEVSLFAFLTSHKFEVRQNTVNP